MHHACSTIDKEKSRRVRRVKPLRSETLAERVYESLRFSILGNELRSGDALCIDEIARQLEVSTTPVREAMRRLSADGLVDLLPNRTPTVTKITKEEIGEIYDVRLLLEPRAAESAIAGLSSGQASFPSATDWMSAKSRMLTFLDRLSEEPLDLRSYEEYVDSDWGIQELLAAGAGKGLLRKLIELTNNYVYRLRLFTESSSEVERHERMRTVLLEHLDIIDAVLHSDCQTAAEAISKHLRLGKERTLSGFDTPSALPVEGSQRTQNSTLPLGGSEPWED
jgi:DNA-binding GntR family transcriptional regulator